MNQTTMKIAKVAVKVIGIAATFATGYFADKELDDKISKKAAEAVANAMKKGES